MRLEPLGELSPRKDAPDWLVSASVAVPFLEGESLRFTLKRLEGDPKPEEFTAAIQAFLALGAVDRMAVAPHVFQHYATIAADWGLAPGVPRLSEVSEVWAHVEASEIHVSRRHRRDGRVYVQLFAECPWDPEHGLQLVFRDGARLSRVSEQDDHLTHTDACDLPEDQDRIQ